MGEWRRVTKREPCPVCQRDHYCCISLDGTVLCMRIENNHPHTFKDGSLGWIHKPNGEAKRPAASARKEPEPVPTINAKALMDQFSADTSVSALKGLASSLGVSLHSVMAMGWAWAAPHRAWAVPMFSGYGEMVGIRLRTPDGRKLAVRGSHQGLFVPRCQPQSTAIITEGPTDACSALTLGLWPIGRPSASGAITDTIAAIRRLGVRKAVIVSDTDDQQEREHGRNPGISGALSLQKFLPIPSAILALPAKDLREFLVNGGTRELMDCLIKQLVWNYPRFERQETTE